jgi:chromosome segregation ATPase
MPTAVAEVGPIEGLERKLEDLLSRYEKSCRENAELRSALSETKAELAQVVQEGKLQRQEIGALKAEIQELKAENAALKAESASLKNDRETIKERIARLISQVEEHLVQPA